MLMFTAASSGSGGGGGDEVRSVLSALEANAVVDADDAYVEVPRLCTHREWKGGPI